MASFFEKLIGGQNQEEEKPAEKKSAPKSFYEKPAKKSLKSKAPPKDIEEGEEESPKEGEKKSRRPQIEEEIKAGAKEPEIWEEAETEPAEKLVKKPSLKESDWPLSEGQLAIDVYQTEKEIVIQSAIGGVKPNDLEITIENGIVQIKGSRQKSETIEKDNYFIQECHWGSFSRQFVLPSEVDASRAEANLKDGILIIRIPKIQREKVTKLLIKE
ncbi:MAG: Hsp20/alpha crystallin family protein [bacterium]|nr:Hsp20/alpha crystallin family protein [bacterium]